jgi:hypothetical protein
MSPSQQSQWLGLVQTASAQVKKARTLDADWAPGTLEAADFALDATLAGQAPPTPEPAPPQIAAVIGTYSGHGLAKDSYAGLTPEQVSWGPHHGLPIIAPADGRVEVYTFGTPLSLVPLNPQYAAQHQALFDGWTCKAPEQRIAWPGDNVATLFGAQTMYVAVFWPAAPLTIEGQRVGHLHYGHVRGDVRTGAIARGEQFATSWDSGIRFEPGVPHARAAHTHCCAGAGTTLSPNGDLPGRLAAVAQGWTVTDIGTIPGPQDYQGGRYTAGRLTSDFTSAGRPIPPMPGQ